MSAMDSAGRVPSTPRRVSEWNGTSFSARTAERPLLSLSRTDNHKASSTLTTCIFALMNSELSRELVVAQSILGITQ